MTKIQVYDTDGEVIQSLTQWDEGIYACVKEDAITKAYDVHFYNATSEVSYIVESSYSSGTLKVRIPNALLAEPHPIYGCVYVDKDNGYRTMYQFYIPVRKRPEPDTYVDTDSYVSITALQEQVDALESTVDKLTSRVSALEKG